jgi:hypothetical protein
VITISSDEDGEIEVIHVDDDEDIIQIQEASETLIRMRPGTSLIATSRVCDNLRSSSTASGLNQIEQSNLVIMPSSDDNTPLSSPGSRGVPNVSFEAAVILSLPETRTTSVTLARNIPNTHYTEDQWWLGLLWGSLASTYGNTCNMDSFFSHIVYLQRRYPAYFYTVMNLVDNTAENAIFEIIKIARNDVYGPRSRNRLIRENWISRFPNVFTNIIQRDGIDTVNCLGGEGANIYQQLTNSSRMWLAHECNCDQTSFQLNGYSVLRWTAESLRWLSNANTPAVRLSNHLTSLERLTCHQCLNSYRFLRGFIATSTWIHQFLIDSPNAQEPFRFETYPTIIEFIELTTQRTVQFELAYFSIGSEMGTAIDPTTGRRRVTNPLTHQTSVHYIEGRGLQYYDGANFPDGTDIPDNLWNDHTVISVTYIRKPE